MYKIFIHQCNTVNYLQFFLAEMRVAFDMFCIAPVEALLALDLMPIPEANKNCITYGQDFFNVAFEFYGNSEGGIYEGCIKISPVLLNCTNKSLQL